MNIGTHEALLIIEDQPGTQAALETLFEKHYRVEIQPDIASAISAMRKRTFAVAILDLSLPDGSGENLLKSLKQAWPHTEVIVVTAAKDQTSEESCFRLGAYDYFIKPWDNDALRRSVRHAAEHYALKRKLIASGARSAKLPIRPGKGGGPIEGQLLKMVSKSGFKYPALLKSLEYVAIKHALEQTQWNQVHAAKLLGVHRNTVVKMMKRQKLPTAARPKGLKKTKSN